MPRIGVFLAVTAAGYGQMGSAAGFNPFSTGQQGLHLYDVSFYSAYYSEGGPIGVGAPLQMFTGAPMAAVSASATIGGTHLGQRSEFSWSYSPSYLDTLQVGHISAHGSMNHSAGANWTEKIGNTGEWSISASIAAMIMDLEELYTAGAAPPAGASLTGGGAASAASDLASFSSSAMSPPLLSAEQAYLYGNRMFDASAGATVTWTPSTRTSASLTMTGTRMQSLSRWDGGTGTAPSALPQNTDARASLAWKYSVSPRTQIGLEVTGDRMFSRIEQGYASSSLVSLSRMLTQRWFAEVTGGAGKTMYSSQTYAVPAAIQYLYGADVGFRGFANAIAFAYDRTLGDVYGLGSASTTATTASWTWKRPGSAWSISGDGGLQKLDNLTYKNTLSWRAGGSISRRVAPHVFITLQYTYLQLPGELGGGGAQVSDNGVIASMTWSPSTYR